MESSSHYIIVLTMQAWQLDKAFHKLCIKNIQDSQKYTFFFIKSNIDFFNTGFYILWV